MTYTCHIVCYILKQAYINQPVCDIVNNEENLYLVGVWS